MNAWTIYWILQLDSIGGAVTTAAAFSAIAAFGPRLFNAIHYSEDRYSWNEGRIEERKAFRAMLGRWSTVATVVFVPLFIASVLMPSTKTAASMIIVPAIANNETIRKESGELYDLAKQALRDAVTDKAKDAAKEVAP